MVLAAGGVSIVVFTASGFMHAYCVFSDVDKDTIKSYDKAVIAALFFWAVIGLCVLGYLERKDRKQEKENVTEQN